MWEEIERGDSTSDLVARAGMLESRVDEGQRAKLKMVFASAVPSFTCDAFRNVLQSQGVDELQINHTGNTLEICYRKNPWWLPVILTALAVIAILLILWIFYKESPITTNLILIAAIMGGVGVIMLLNKGSPK